MGHGAAREPGGPQGLARRGGRVQPRALPAAARAGVAGGEVGVAVWAEDFHGAGWWGEWGGGVLCNAASRMRLGAGGENCQWLIVNCQWSMEWCAVRRICDCMVAASRMRLGRGEIVNGTLSRLNRTSLGAISFYPDSQSGEFCYTTPHHGCGWELGKLSMANGRLSMANAGRWTSRCLRGRRNVFPPRRKGK